MSQSKQFDNTNSGMLRRNDKSGPDANPKWPDYKGVINIDGVDFWLSGWLRRDKSDRPYMSLAVQPKDAGGQKRASHAAPHAAPSSSPGATGFDDMADDIPF